MAVATERMQKLSTPRPPRPYVHPYWGGLLLGIVLFLSFFLTGNGLGASGGLNRIIVYGQDLIAPDHVDRVPYLLKLAGGDKNPLDDWVVPMVFGTLLGGAVSGWLNGRLKVETNKGPNISVRSRWFWALVAPICWPILCAGCGISQGDDRQATTTKRRPTTAEFRRPSSVVIHENHVRR